MRSAERRSLNVMNSLEVEAVLPRWALVVVVAISFERS